MNQRLRGESWITSSNKRAFDAAVSTALFPLAFSASTLGACVFFAESRVNPLIYQRRMGRNNDSIRVLKLRTMPFNHDFSDGGSGPADDRASKIGKILRVTTVDEAPQVVHILRGQMSVVGPRPLVPSEVDNTMDVLSPAEQKEWLRARAIAKPGWLSEFANLSREIVPQSEAYYLARVANDCRYTQSASFETDLRIIQNALGVGAEVLKQA